MPDNRRPHAIQTKTARHCCRAVHVFCQRRNYCSVTPTGVGTLVAEGKRQIDVDGKPFLLETAIRAQFALIHAFLADYLGNLTYVLTARNFNPIMAMAADTVIVTAEHIVPVGVIAPDHVVTPAPLVDYLITNG